MTSKKRYRRFTVPRQRPDRWAIPVALDSIAVEGTDCTLAYGGTNQLSHSPLLIGAEGSRHIDTPSFCQLQSRFSPEPVMCVAIELGKTNVDALKLATQCRAWVQSRYAVTSCIESAFLFERTAHHLGMEVTRVVCQATAMTPLLAQAVAEGRDAKPLMSEPGYWAVGVGLPQFPDDFVGRMELEKNRFVGHVVCLTDTHLIDPSVDQLNRPDKQLFLEHPLIAPYEGGAIVVGFGGQGTVVRYVLHATVPVPAPRTDKKLERTAKTLALEWLKNLQPG